MANQIPCFDRVYIVNLPERADRRAEMDAELANIDLKVDNQQIRYFAAYRPDDAGGFPSLGARGCFISHLRILVEAQAAQLNSVLIMEDDLQLDPRFIELLPMFEQQLAKQNWQFAYFGHLLADSSPMPQLVCTQQPIATTHFYALHHSVFTPLIEHLQDCLLRPVGHPLGSPMHVDGAYSLFREQHPEYRTLITTPSLGHQRSSRSDIFPNQWYDRFFITRPLISYARKIKNNLPNKVSLTTNL